MTADDFTRRLHDQNDKLHMQMQALDAGPKTRRRKFVLWEAVCQGCGDVLAEVLALHPWRVLHFRGLERAEPAAHRGVELRSGGWEFLPMPACEPTESAATLIHCTCRCRTAQLSLRHIFALLAADTRKTVMPK